MQQPLNLEAQVKEQQQIIKFLASKYEKDTGMKLSMPQQIGQLLGDPSILGSMKIGEQAAEIAKKQEERERTFIRAVEDLKMPKPPTVEKGKPAKVKKDISFAPEHMITKIDLSGFFTSCSRISIRQLLDGIEMLPCLRSLSLRNNGINDDFEKEILSIFDNKKIVAIDLSQNQMGSKLGLQIGKAIKDCTHIQWIDLTQNCFYNHKEPQAT